MNAFTTPKKKMDRGQNIQVFVRVRPLNSSEKASRSCSVVDTPGGREVVVKEKATSSMTKTFNFDRVFGPQSRQQDVFKSVVGPLIPQVMQGYNCTVFAYGQTGTGKTYTMEGLSGAEATGVPIESDPESGIIPRALSDLFDGLRTGDATEWSVRVSFLELYNEEIFDLLSGTDDQTKLRLYEDGLRKGSVIIQGLEEVQVHDKQEVYRILERGSEKRRTAETRMNANSSRSHTVFTVTVFINQQSIDGDDMLKIGKLNLVDLAGSENIGRSGAVDKRAREAGNINQSLLTLGRVITSLVDRAPHIPYRESKLTRLLQDSLGGRTKTSIIATVSPASVNLEETLSTLDYAYRAKNITNKPEVNQKISKKEKLLEYHAEIDKLKAELQAARDKDGVFLPKETFDEQIKQKEGADAEIREKTILLKALEEELEKFKKIISETQARLEETTAAKERTQRALDCTRTVLHKTEGDRAEQAHLVSRHIDTECQLSQQAQLLLEVSDQATQDLDKVHDKLERKRLVEDSNQQTLGAYREDHSSRYNRLDGLVGSHVDAQTQFCSQHRERVDLEAERRAEERSQLTSTYTDTVSKLIETMGDIERATSDHMYTEQSWVEQLLKRVRNEADSATGAFHSYLVDQLLGVSTKILAALQKQDKSVQELSAKMDKSFAGINERLEKYLGDSTAFRKERSLSEDEFFAGLLRRNGMLSETFRSDQEASEDYKKKSNMFTEQMLSLIRARAEEEEKFLTARNASLTTALEVTSASSEAGQAARQEAMQATHASDAMATGLRDTHSEAMRREEAERASTLVEIKKAGQAAAAATTQLRTDAEVFAQNAKDKWADHYAKTETALRSKSDQSSAHVASLQGMTGTAKKAVLNTQSSAEDAIEGWRRADEKATRSAHESVSAQCSELTGFGSTIRDELRAADRAVFSLVEKQMKADLPTGQTPSRVVRSFPTQLVQGTPDDLRKERFRAKWNNVAAVKMDIIMDDTIEQEEDLEEEDEMADSVFSDSKPSSAALSRQNSGGNVPKMLRSNKSSKTNLSEVSSIDTGFTSDMDSNKENSKTFAKPRAARAPTKLKLPDQQYSGIPTSRSSSRTRATNKLQQQQMSN